MVLRSKFSTLFFIEFINKMRLFHIQLLNSNLTNPKSRIGNNLETSEQL